MPPSPTNIPKLRRHPKGSVVVLDGKYVYCGPFGSAEARQKYGRLIREWLANGRRLPPPNPAAPPLTVEGLLLRYWRFVQSYYVKGGAPTSVRARRITFLTTMIPSRGRSISWRFSDV
jgi:hypothetical protein